MARQTRQFFFSSSTGVTGRLFRTGNIPNEVNYRNLFDSVLMFNEVSDTSKETLPGHVKLETDTRAITRSLPHADGYSRHLQSHQLPLLYGELQPYQSADHTWLGRGIRITEAIAQISYINRKDFIIENTLAFTSVDNTLAITEAVSGTIDFAMGAGLINSLYKVKADSSDATPGYLVDKVGDTMLISSADKLEVDTDDTNSIVFTAAGTGLQADVQINDTNTIDLSIGVSGVEGDLRYNTTHFDENASGLFLKPLGIDYTLLANGTITIGKLNSNIFGDGLTVGATVDVDCQHSIELNGASPNKILQLDGDVGSPGNSMVYGTSAVGTKGWYSFASFNYWEQDTAGSGTGLFMKNSSSSATGDKAISLGVSCASKGNYSTTKGKGSVTWLETQNAISSGEIAISGDSQKGEVVLSSQNSGAGDVEMSIGNNGTSFFTVPENSAILAEISVIGYGETSGKVISLVETGTYVNNAGAVSLISTVTTVHSKKDFSGAAAIAITPVLDRIRIISTGEAGENINFSATIRYQIIGRTGFSI